MLHDAPAPLALMTAPISSRAWTVYNRRSSAREQARQWVPAHDAIVLVHRPPQVLDEGVSQEDTLLTAFPVEAHKPAPCA
jgi:hypothetical protein